MIEEREIERAQKVLECGWGLKILRLKKGVWERRDGVVWGLVGVQKIFERCETGVDSALHFFRLQRLLFTV
jgi:hypothetical protein